MVGKRTGARNEKGEGPRGVHTLRNYRIQSDKKREINRANSRANINGYFKTSSPRTFFGIIASPFFVNPMRISSREVSLPLLTKLSISSSHSSMKMS